jgi:hypothetical protein
MSVFAHKQRTADSLIPSVIGDGLSNGQGMRFGKRGVRTGAAMPASAEADKLIRVGRVGPFVIKGSFEPADVNQKIFRAGLSA